MKKSIFLLLSFVVFTLYAQKIEISVHPQTGGISSVKIDHDTTGMNWIVASDGS